MEPMSAKILQTGVEAQTSTTGNHEYLYLKSPNELTRTMVLLSKVNISIWGNPRKIGRYILLLQRVNSSSFVMHVDTYIIAFVIGRPNRPINKASKI
jgi:hypothetical protein